nr:AAA family ATPase [uncultured Massilia sp.]
MKEVPLSQKFFSLLGHEDQPPCTKEGAGFMSPKAFETKHSHPYAYLWQNLQETTLQHFPYSVCVVPFERMRKEVAAEHAEDWGLDYKAAREPDETRAKSWVNDDKNQDSLLNGFFDALRPSDSLVFFYAKRTPLTEEPGSVLIGVARIKDIPKGRDWAGSDQGKRQVFWDRVIPHTLRPDLEDGFLMPYAEILKECKDRDLDCSAYTAFVPDATGTDFQYRAGLVSPDSSLAALRSLQRALTNAVEDLSLQSSWRKVQQWLSERIRECWVDRGPCPGLRVALGAAGLPSPALAALTLHELAGPTNPWRFVDECLTGSPPTATLARLFRGLAGQRLKLMREKEAAQYKVIQLLSRFNISKTQAKAWWTKPDAACAVDDPYQLYLGTRSDKEPIPFQAIDRTLYGESPSEGIDVGLSEDWHDPLIDDPRRLAAIVIEALERGAQAGHTWLPEEAIIDAVAEIVEDQPPSIQQGDLDILADLLLGEINKVGSDGWQLARLAAAESIIRDEVTRRFDAKPSMTDFDARALVDAAISKPLAGERDEAARTEKAEALKTIVGSSISTLDGPAGTGKTSVIKALVNIPNIGNILCLAPTGKARVQIERSFLNAAVRPETKTVHSFLRNLKRWDYDTGEFDISPDGMKCQGYGLIVIDEASMFDVEMLAAVLSGCAECVRVVLVGDPRQLPPIGPGRPFVDILDHIKEVKGPSSQLTNIMRATPGEDAPFEFARLFDLSRESKDDEPWSWPSQRSVGNLQFKFWQDELELRRLVVQWVRAHLENASDSTAASFDASLGGRLYGSSYYFNLGCGARAEDWQILSPRRAGTAGSEELNLLVKTEFRNEWLTLAQQGMFVQSYGRFFKQIPKPFGDAQVTYGDKVICNANHANSDYYSPASTPLGFVANGEVGIAIGPRRSSKAPKIPLKKLGVEFSSQPGTQYNFKEEDLLELAYALTVHRTQGSQFKETLVVVPDTHFVGPEMLYTALTRSEGPVTLLVESDARTLLAATHPKRSAVGCRLTNVFSRSEWGRDLGTWFDRKRIHRATDGTYVRSKSELVIANLLHSKEIEYEYEARLERGGELKRPDFVIKTTKRTYYWEHLGMLTNAQYAKDWKKKKAWYHQSGITIDSEKERLICTIDNPDGSLDSQIIEKEIKNLE